ncbi:hypothetical protein L1887_59707 [Cichorium endivia]|nr:hypothetical protein L1887_59707 [Cichorium endivia]
MSSPIRLQSSARFGRGVMIQGEGMVIHTRLFCFAGANQTGAGHPLHPTAASCERWHATGASLGGRCTGCVARNQSNAIKSCRGLIRGVCVEARYTCCLYSECAPYWLCGNVCRRASVVVSLTKRGKAVSLTRHRDAHRLVGTCWS